MQNKVSFNFNKAGSLVNSLTENRDRVNGALNNIEMELKAMPEWWDGEALDAYMKRFDKVTGDLKAYVRILDDTLKYVTKVSNEKDAFEKKNKVLFRYR